MSTHSLQQAAHCTELLFNSSSAKERKNALTTLLELIKNERIHSAIDESTLLSFKEPKINEKITWTRIVEALISCITKESEKVLQKSLSKKTIQNSFVGAASFLKNFLDIVERRGHRLFRCIHTLLKHFIEIFKEDKLICEIGVEYNNILQNVILSTPAYFQLIKRTQYKALIENYIRILLSSADTDKVIQQTHARVLLTLVMNAPFDISPYFDTLSNFFVQFLSDHCQDNKMTYYILTALNYFLRKAGINDCNSVNLLTTKLNDVLIRRWSLIRSVELKEQFIQYFRLQFRFSLCPGDSTKPIPALDALYKIINKELNDNPQYLQSSPSTGFGRVKNSGSMTMNIEYRLTYLAFIFLDLAADTFKRIGSHTEVQSVPLETDNEMSTSADRKRRKVSRDIKDIFSHHFSSSSIEQNLRWIQLFSIFVMKYPLFFEIESIEQFIHDFVVLIEKVKERPEVELWILQCFKSLVLASDVFMKQQRTNPETSNSSGNLRSSSKNFQVKARLRMSWIHAWEAFVLKISHAHTIVAEFALKIMKLLVEYQLVDSQFVMNTQGDVWKLFVFNDFNACTWTAIDFMTTFLERYDLREESTDSYTQREKLLRWILSALRQAYDNNRTLRGQEECVFPFIASRGIAKLMYFPVFPIIESSPLKDPMLEISTIRNEERVSASTTLGKVSIRGFDNMIIEFEKQQITVEIQLIHIEETRTLSSYLSLPSNVLPFMSINSSNDIIFMASNPSQLNSCPQNKLSKLGKHFTTVQETFLFLFPRNTQLLLDECNSVLEEKSKTLGIDKNKLCNCLVKLIQHSQVTALLIVYFDARKGSRDSILTLLFDFLQKMLSWIANNLMKLEQDHRLLRRCFIQLSHFFLIWNEPALQCRRDLLDPIIQQCVNFINGELKKQTSSTNRNQGVISDMDDSTEIFEFDNDLATTSSDFQRQNSFSELTEMTIGAATRLLFTTKSFSMASNSHCDTLSQILASTKDNELIFQICQLMIQQKDIKYKTHSLKKLETILQEPEISGDNEAQCKVLNLLRCAMNIREQNDSTVSASPAENPTVSHHSLNTTETTSIINDIFHVLNIFLSLFQKGKLNWTTKLYLLYCLRDLLANKVDQLNHQQRDRISKVFLAMLKDSDYRVRLSLSKTVTLLFRLSTDHRTLYKDIRKELHSFLSEKDFSEEHCVSSLLTLSAIACVSPDNEREIILDLFVFAVQQPTDRTALIPLILDNISKSLHYPSRLIWLEEHLSWLIGEWIKTKRFSILQFPIYLFGFGDQTQAPSTDGNSLQIEQNVSIKSKEHNKEFQFAKFFDRYQSIIIPKLVFFLDKETLEHVAKVMDKPLELLLRENLAPIFAISFPLYFTKQKELGESIWEDFLQDYINVDVINSLIPEVLDDILVCLLDVITFPELTISETKNANSVVLSTKSEPGVELEPPEYGPNTIKQVIEKTAKGFKNGDVHFLLCKPPGRIQQMLLHLNLRLADAVKQKERIRIAHVIDFFFDLLAENVATQTILRDAIYTVLRLFKYDDEVQRKGTEILLKICRHALRHNPQELARHLGVIVPILVPLAQISTTQIGQRCCEILNTIILNNDKQIQESVRLLHPFPTTATFAALNERYMKLCGKRDIWSEIHHFVTVSKTLYRHSAYPTTLTRLVTLKRKLHEKIEEIHIALIKGEQEPRSLIELMWSLIRFCAPKYEEGIRIKAAECLGEICGVIPFDSIGFSSSLFVEDDLKSDFLIPHSSVKIAILKKLNVYLAHPDIHVVELATKTLLCILATQSGILAFEQLDNETKNYLLPYKSSKKANDAKQFSLSGRIHFWNSDSLWETKNKSYIEWLCDLAYAMCSTGVVDEVLKLCAFLCKNNFEFAEFLFPHLFEDLLTSRDAQNLPKRIESLLTETHDNTETIQLILNTLNFLRKQAMATRLQNLYNIGDIENTIPSLLNPSSMFQNSQSNKLRYLWDLPFWNVLDFFDIAIASSKCNAFYTSFLYLELWVEKTFGTLDVSTTLTANSNLMTIDIRHKIDSLLNTIFSNINEPDYIYALETDNWSVEAEIRKYQHESNWNETLGAYNVLLQKSQLQNVNAKSLSSSSTATESSSFPIPLYQNFLLSLQNLGYHHLVNFYLKGFATQYSNYFANLSEFQFQEAWRSTNWHLDDFNMNRLMEEGNKLEFHCTTYVSLRAIVEGDAHSLSNLLHRIRLELANEIGFIGAESTKNIFPILTKLQFFNEIENAWKIRWHHKSEPQQEDMRINTSEIIKHLREPHVPTDEEILSLERQWKNNVLQFGAHIQNSFEVIEPLLALRGVLLTIFQRQDRMQYHLIDLARKARKSRRFQIASNTIYQLKSCATVSNEKFENYLWRFEESKVLWAKGATTKAVKLVKTLIQDLSAEIPNLETKSKSNSNPSFLSLERSSLIDKSKGTNNHPIKTLYADVLCLTGKWLAQTHSESSQTIHQYLKKAVSIYQECRTKVAKGYFTLACFADSLYQSLIAKMRSPEWEDIREFRKRRERELAKLEKIFKQSLENQEQKRALERHVEELKKEIAADRSEDQKMEEERKLFLFDAIQNYVSCLINEDKYDIRAVFRLCSLWFSNPNDKDINYYLKNAIPTINSRKFLPLFYQIASRISMTESSFQGVLTLLINKVCSQCPHHSLFQIFALSNGNHVSIDQRNKSRLHVDSDKVEAAQRILNQLRQTKLKDLVDQMKVLIEAYIELAFFDVTPWKKSRQPIELPAKLKIRLISDLNLVHVPTAPLPSVPGIGQIISIKKFNSTFTLAGGLNLPKIIDCIGSDGKLYKQLVKGKDDLRQDAVMQQIFQMVNTFLKENVETRKRQLNIKTYKVIPLTPCSGVLEWVQNSTPLGTYLVGSPLNPKASAHYFYRPQDWLSIDCRKKLAAASEREKLDVYKQITENFKPVFHHFFLERFPNPAHWFERRLAYTRSVATGSMVGYMLGLGDRHAQNILILNESAEIVHIDLGVAFEQGKMLKTPETVPFRLTRDIVDAMGITGVEGVFRRCCEETLKVLRQQHESLLTIVEVFLHDPLYKWTLSPLRALQLQQDETEFNENEINTATDDSDNGCNNNGPHDGSNNLNGGQRVNVNAEKTLLRLKQKLQGYENGEILNVEGQVEQLICQARDPELLCKMFPGWAPWL